MQLKSSIHNIHLHETAKLDTFDIPIILVIMTRNSHTFGRMLLTFVLAFILAGLSETIYGFLAHEKIVWALVFQVAVLSGLIAFLVVAWKERGALYVILTITIVAVAGGLVGGILESKVAQILIFFIMQIIYLAFILIGDAMGRPRLLLRTLFGALAGFAAGIVSFGLFGVLVERVGGFWIAIQSSLAFIMELALSVAVGTFIGRLILGERENIKPEEIEQ